MSSDYIYSPIEADEDALNDSAIAYLQARWPDWEPEDGHLETWQIQALTSLVAEALFVGSDVPMAIFKYYGTTILGLPMVSATYAEVSSTWALSSNPAGRTIEAGTYVGIEGSDGSLVTFEVVNDVVLAALDLGTDPGGVLLRAVDPGSEHQNGIGGVGELAQLIDDLNWVASITLTGATAGGGEEELDEDYLARLSARLTLLTPRPILPRDFEILSRDIAVQNGYTIRALALDGYDPDVNAGSWDPDNSATWQERTIGIATSNAVTGLDAPAGFNTILATELETQRELNFVVKVFNATRTLVDVTYTISVLEGYDGPTVVADTTAALTESLQPYNWGKYSAEIADQLSWRYIKKYLRQYASNVINGVQGVDRWTALTVGLNGGAQTTAEEFTLPGAAPLTTPGAIVGSYA